MIRLSTFPILGWFVAWLIAGILLKRLDTQWSLFVAVPLVGLMLFVHARLGRSELSAGGAPAPSLRRPTRSALAWVVLTAPLLAAVTIAATVTRAAMGRHLPPERYADGFEGSLGLALVFAPVAYELFFRGWLLPQLRKSTGVWMAMLGSAFAFALVAPLLTVAGPFGDLSSRVALGLSAAVLVVVTRSIWAALLLHVLHNTVVLGLAWLFQDRLSPLLTGERQSSVPKAVIFEAIVVLLWAFILNFVWKKAGRPSDAPLDASRLPVVAP